MSTAMQSYAADQPFAPRWSANSLVWVKATGEQTEGRLSVLEPVIPAGFACPWHVHHTEDELIYVIRGQLTVSFIIEASEPGAAPSLPEPTRAGFWKVGDLARRHGQEILGAFPR